MATNWFGMPVPDVRFEDSVAAGWLKGLGRLVKGEGQYNKSNNYGLTDVTKGDHSGQLAPLNTPTRRSTSGATSSSWMDDFAKQRFAPPKSLPTTAIVRPGYTGRTQAPTPGFTPRQPPRAPLPPSLEDQIRGAYDGRVAVPTAQDPRSMYADYERSLRDRQAGLAAQYDREIGRLRGNFNLEGQDPDLIAIRDHMIGELRGQAVAADAAVRESYRQGIASTDAAAATARRDAQTTSAQIGDIFRQGAGDIRTGNAAASAQAANQYGGLGAGGVLEGGAADYANEVAAAAPREQALALALGNLAADAQKGWSASMTEQSSRDQGQIQRETQARVAGANQTWGQQEAQRITQERAQFADQAAALAGQFNQRADSSQGRLDDLAMTIAQQRSGTADRERMAAIEYNYGLDSKDRETNVRLLADQLAERRAREQEARDRAEEQRAAQSFLSPKIRESVLKSGGGSPYTYETGKLNPDDTPELAQVNPALASRKILAGIDMAARTASAGGTSGQRDRFTDQVAAYMSNADPEVRKFLADKGITSPEQLINDFLPEGF